MSSGTGYLQVAALLQSMGRPLPDEHPGDDQSDGRAVLSIAPKKCDHFCKNRDVRKPLRRIGDERLPLRQESLAIGPPFYQQCIEALLGIERCIPAVAPCGFEIDSLGRQQVLKCEAMRFGRDDETTSARSNRSADERADRGEQHRVVFVELHEMLVRRVASHGGNERPSLRKFHSASPATSARDRCNVARKEQR